MAILRYSMILVDSSIFGSPEEGSVLSLEPETIPHVKTVPYTFISVGTEKEEPDVKVGGVYRGEWFKEHLEGNMRDFSTGDTPAGPASGSVPDLLEENRLELEKMQRDGVSTGVLLSFEKGPYRP